MKGDVRMPEHESQNSEKRSAITDDLYRAVNVDGASYEVRETESGESERVLFGHFSVFNEFYEINSMFEGRFMEIVEPGAFERTLRERGTSIKVMLDHGMDP